MPVGQPCISLRPSDMQGHAGAREIDGVVRVNKVTIDLRSRHSTKRMHAVQGLWNPSTSSLTRGPGCLGQPCISLRPSDMRAHRAREIGWLCGSTVTIDLRSRHSTKRMHAVQGLWNPSTSSLTRGPSGAALASHSRPLTCGARRAREIDWLCGSTVTIDLRSRHSTKRMHAVQGLWNPSTSSLTRGPLGGAAASHSRPSDMQERRLEKLMGWLCGQSYDRFTIAPLDQTNACRAGYESFY
jgi:hypothetical protein